MKKDFEKNCFGVKKGNLKEEVFMLSFENEMKCGVCGIDED